MWPLPRLQNELVTLVLTPETLTCAWFKQHKPSLKNLFSKTSIHKNKPPFTLHAYRQIPLEHQQFTQAILYNPTFIQQQITSFLAEHTLAHAFISLSISGDRVLQRLISMDTAMPTRAHFLIPELAHMRWDYQYLYPNQDGTFTFYLYGIRQEQLLQYKLLARAASLNLVSIMPSWATQLQLYKHTQSAPFSQHALAAAVEKSDSIDQLIPAEQLPLLCSLALESIPAQLTSLYTQKANPERDTSQLACMLGLFTAGRLYEYNKFN